MQPYPTVDGQQAAEITLDKVRLDGGRVLGAMGKYDTLDAVLQDATLAVCAEAVGIMRIMTEKTVEY